MARVDTVRIEGLAQLDRALRELPQRVGNRGLRASVYAGAKVIRDEARARAPKAAQSLGPKQPPPGTLKRSVIMRHPMIETLLGGLLGGAFRLAPEILKWLDRKGERGHELAMQDKALEFEKLRGAQRMVEIGAAADAAWNTGAVDALKEAVAAQGHRSGVRWADALSARACQKFCV